MSRFSHSLFLAMATTSLTISVPALADNHTAPKPAPVSELVDEVNIPYEEFTLENGLKVLVHTDRKAPVVAVSIWYGVGSAHEPKGKTGYAHLFEHIMFNGSEREISLSHSDKLARPILTAQLGWTEPTIFRPFQNQH